MDSWLREALVHDMTWSHSRVSCFGDCRYQWFLRYLAPPEGERKKLFFASYGSFVHDLLAAYHRGEKEREKLVTAYLLGFRDAVPASAPNPKVFQNYFGEGLAYLKSLTPTGRSALEVEEKAEFRVDGYKFVGFIDLLEADEGQLILVDHKSRNLKPRNLKRATKANDELDDCLRQLYLYSSYIRKRYGRFPDKLCFNCFRQGLVIEKPFYLDAYNNTMLWYSEKIHEIEHEEDFEPDIEFFKCRYLCDVNEHCEYYRLSKR